MSDPRHPADQLGENWDVLDVYRRRTGKRIHRGQPCGPGEYHLVVHLGLFNSRGELLSQQRTAGKSIWPGYWDVTVGGSALAGETSQQAIRREVAEEIGLTLDFSALRPAFTTTFPEGFDDYYIIKRDLDPAGLKLQAEEVAAVAWMSREAVLTAVQQGRFIPYHRGLLELLFDMQDGDTEW